MKKILLAAICCGMTFFGNFNPVEAEEQQITNINQSATSDFQELSAWPRIRDSILGRDRHEYRPPPPPPQRPSPQPRQPYGPPPPPPPHHRNPPPPPGHRPPPPGHYSVQQDIELPDVYNEK